MSITQLIMLLSRKTLCYAFLLALALSAWELKAQPVPANTGDIHITPVTVPVAELGDVVINCDMLEGGDSDFGDGNIKTIAWDNGVRQISAIFPSFAPQAWFWVEDGSGHSVITPLQPYTKQPDIVLGHADFGNGTEYAVAVVYLVEQNPFPTTPPVHTTADVWVDVYRLANVGSPGFSVNFVNQQQLTPGASIITDHGYTDGNPHIDMWTDDTVTFNGHPTLHELAIVWSESFIPAGAGTPGNVVYTHGDLSDLIAGIGLPVPTIVGTSSGMADVACVTDYSSGMGGEKQMEIVFSNDLLSNGGSLYVREENLTNPGSSFTVLQTANVGQMPRIEAMSRYYGSDDGIKWQVATSIRDMVTMAWQAWGFNSYGNADHLSDYVTFDTLNCGSTAVAAGVGPSYSGAVGNMQYTTGFYPQDYNHPGMYSNVISRSIDVFSGSVGNEYMVNQSSVVYPWDVNRIYAVSNCSNSGKDILSAMFNGNDIVYKVTPNSFSYKGGGVTGIIHNPAKPGIRLYPNPATDRIKVTGAEHAAFEISDITGRSLLHGNNTLHAINVSALPPGIYIIKLTGKGKHTQTLTFTKQ